MKSQIPGVAPAIASWAWNPIVAPGHRGLGGFERWSGAWRGRLQRQHLRTRLSLQI